EPVVEADRVLRDPAHRPRRVRLEGQAGRVRRGAARLEQWALIDQEDVARAELREVVRGRGADDAGADDDGLRAVLHRMPTMLTVAVAPTTSPLRCRQLAARRRRTPRRWRRPRSGRPTFQIRKTGKPRLPTAPRGRRR